MHARSLVVVALFASASLLAQVAATTRESYGIGIVEGEVRAGGPDYAARFTADGVTYLALSHQHGVDAASLRFRFAAVARGGCDHLVRAANAVPTVAGQEVHYEHGGVREVYAAQVDGIEQSFVIAQRPDGEGDLVVRGEITTDLPVTAASAGGLCFERDGRGVTFGAVTGVDANGARMPGTLHLRGNSLELTLPAAFVEHAAYPLTVDPLIGSAFTVGNVAGVDDDVPAIAYDSTTSRYFVV